MILSGSLLVALIHTVLLCFVHSRYLPMEGCGFGNLSSSSERFRHSTLRPANWSRLLLSFTATYPPSSIQLKALFIPSNNPYLLSKMTNEHGIGGTALCNPTSTPDGMKHSLRSAAAAKDANDAERLEDEALIKEEDKMMEDEEITSDEDADGEDDKDVTERAMLTVALVKSVVDSRGEAAAAGDQRREAAAAPPPPASAESGGGGAGEPPESPNSHRYGLRKRRRASGHDLDRLETFQSSNAGGLARAGGDKNSPELLPAAPPDQQPQALVAAVPATPLEAAAAAKPPKRSPQRPKGASPRSKKATAAAAFTAAAAEKPQPPMASSSSFVPNPLAVPFVDDSQGPPVPEQQGSCGAVSAAALPYLIPGPVPAPPIAPAVEAPASEKRKVTINESGMNRKRGFSIDLDCMYTSA